MSFILHWNVSPIAFSTPFGSIHWYGLFFSLGVFLCSHLFESQLKEEVPKKVLDQVVLFIVLCMMVGAKVGYLIFYTPLSQWPFVLLSLKGLSFHGGLIGLVIGLRSSAAQYSISFWALADTLSCAVPFGLFFGRIGNFFNSELFGRPTFQNYGIVFEQSDKMLLARHPSQLYEAACEGLLLGIILFSLPPSWRKRDGLPSAIFLMGYGILRCVIEEFRQPDAQIGFIQGWTMGQLLSSAMIIAGFVLFLASVVSAQGPRSMPIYDRSKEMVCPLKLKKV